MTRMRSSTIGFQIGLSLLFLLEAHVLAEDDGESSAQQDKVLFSFSPFGEDKDKVSGDAKAVLALSLVAAHRFEKAIDVAQEAVNRSPNLAAAHLALGLALQMTGRAGEAVSEFETAMKLVPENRYVVGEYSRACELARMTSVLPPAEEEKSEK